jgi:N-acetylmuramoyl-L-alanine amidase
MGTQSHGAGASDGAGNLKARSGWLRSAPVQRFRFPFGTALAFTALFATLLCAQVSDQEKGKQEARKEAGSNSSLTDQESPTPKPRSNKRKSRKSPSPSPSASKQKKSADTEETPKPKPKPSETPEAASAKSTEEPEQTPKPKATAKRSGAKKEATPAKKRTGKKKSRAKESPEPKRAAKSGASASPKPSETPSAPPSSGTQLRAVPVATPAGPPAPEPATVASPVTEEPAQLTIEKTGYERPRGFWSRLLGRGRSASGGGYRYLTRAVRAEIDRAPADRRNPRWQMIVVHNSGTRQGNARVFDYYHRHVRHMQNGLAYHFVIGNGTSSGNGQIEVGDRWRRQINGGHVHSDNLNNIALGICLVGDFNRDQPTRAQLDCCEELIRYLRQRCGKIGNRYMVVKPHREVNPPRWATDCPGDAFPYTWFRRFE